jgi:hypothetical protein
MHSKQDKQKTLKPWCLRARPGSQKPENDPFIFLLFNYIFKSNTFFSSQASIRNESIKNIIRRTIISFFFEH